jgi:hypothetical protein
MVRGHHIKKRRIYTCQAIIILSEKKHDIV